MNLRYAVTLLAFVACARPATESSAGSAAIAHASANAPEDPIARALWSINDVREVQLHLSEPQAKPSATVDMTYCPGRGGSKPISEVYVQAVLMASFRGLDPSAVQVRMQPVSDDAGC